MLQQFGQAKQLQARKTLWRECAEVARKHSDAAVPLHCKTNSCHKAATNPLCGRSSAAPGHPTHARHRTSKRTPDEGKSRFSAATPCVSFSELFRRWAVNVWKQRTADPIPFTTRGQAWFSAKFKAFNFPLCTSTVSLSKLRKKATEQCADITQNHRGQAPSSLQALFLHLSPPVSYCLPFSAILPFPLLCSSWLHSTPSSLHISSATRSLIAKERLKIKRSYEKRYAKIQKGHDRERQWRKHVAIDMH